MASLKFRAQPGELFGFKRSRPIGTESANEIAEAAQALDRLATSPVLTLAIA